MRQLKESYGKRGLKILCFPCNSFGQQEPWPIRRIRAYVLDKFDLRQSEEFQITKKVLVNNGEEEKADPMWNWLREKSGNHAEVRWNFHTAFIVDRNSEVLRLDGHSWDRIESEIQERLLSQNESTAGVVGA